MQPTIDYVKGSDGAANASLMTITNDRSGGATTIQVNTVANVSAKFYASMGTPHTFTDPITNETITVISEATATDFAGHVDGTNIEIDEIAPGFTDNGSEVGDVIIIRPVTEWANLVAQFLTPTASIVPFAGASAPDYWLLCDGAAVSRTDYSRLFNAIGTTYGVGDGSSTFNLPDLRTRTPVGVGAGTFSLTFAASDVNTSTEVITVPENTSLQTGTAVVLSGSGTAPTGLTFGATYYVRRVTSTSIKLCSTRANAVANTPINITAQGSGTNTLTQTLTNNTLGAKGGEETHSLTVEELAAHNHDLPNNFLIATSGSKNQPGGGNNTDYRSNLATASAGGSEAHNVMQPFLALNYIIKT